MHLETLTRKDIKTLFAAHVFVFTSRDGSVISRLLNVSPYRLHKLSHSENWEKALKFWGYTADPEIKGKRYKRRFAHQKVKENLKQANKLWRELFGIKPISRKLRKYTGK